jgi:hypothetical protein
MEHQMNIHATEVPNMTPITLEDWKTHLAKLEATVEPRGWVLHKDTRVFEAPAGKYYMGDLHTVMKKTARFIQYDDIEDGLYQKGDSFFMVMDLDAGVLGVASYDLVHAKYANPNKVYTFDKPVTIRINPNLCMASISDGLETETCMLDEDESDMEE